MSAEPIQVNEASPRYNAQAEAHDVPPGYKRTEVGVIPEDWKDVSFGDVVDLLTGFPFPSAGYANSGVLLVRGSNVKRGVLDWNEDITKYWPVVTGDIARYELREGDLVIAMDGALVGRSYATISNADLPSLLLQRVARIRSSVVYQRLLGCWVASDYFVQHVDSVKTHTAIPHISPSDIRNFRIGVPPNQQEQRAIAEALSDVDGLLGALEALIAKKRAFKQAAMQQLLTGLTRLPGFSGEWQTKRLGEIAPLQRGFDLPTLQIEPGSYPVVYSNGILNYHKSAMVKGPGVVTGRSGTIGKVHYVEKDYWPHNTSLWVTSFKGNDPKFVYYLYTNVDLTRFLSGSGVPTLNRNDVHQLVVACPSPAEQIAIANVLIDMDTEIAALEARRDKTRALKQGMMQQLLTGRVRLVKPESHANKR